MPLVCATVDEKTLPNAIALNSLVFHSGITIKGSDPYRPEEFGPAWQTFCEQRFQVAIDSEFALADAGAAQEKLASNDVFGKILLRP